MLRPTVQKVPHVVSWVEPSRSLPFRFCFGVGELFVRFLAWSARHPLNKSFEIARDSCGRVVSVVTRLLFIVFFSRVVDDRRRLSALLGLKKLVLECFENRCVSLGACLVLLCTAGASRLAVL